MAFPPLVLVSQAHRSGGSLLAQLFDDHPELYAHPFEIHIGHPVKWNWPDLDLAAGPGAWLDALFEQKLRQFVATGFAKAGNNPYAGSDARRFDIDLEDLARRFLASAAALPKPTQRAVLDCYFEAFFAAWKDWPASGRERWVTGFTPFTITVADSVARWERDYPDGRLVTLVRDPRSWRVSSRRHAPRAHGDLAESMGVWRHSAASSMAMAERLPGRVLVTTYERLAGDTEATMRRIARFLGIAFRPSLLQPTFLGRKLRPNSSFAVAEYGVNQQGIDRSADLDPAERAFIEREALPLYEEIAAAVARES